jgi:hypothetical protein
MEELSRRVLVALLVGAAGPGAAMLVLLLVAPILVASSMPETDGGVVEGVGSGLVGLLVGGMLSFVVAWVVAAAATLVALRATRCPRPYQAWIMCLLLSPLWSAALLALDLDFAGFVVLLGVLPAAVRFGYGYLEPLGGPASEHAPSSELW